MNHSKATKTQRFVAYLIDFLVIDICVGLLSYGVRSFIHFDADMVVSMQNNFLEKFIDYFLEPGTENKSTMISYFQSYLKYYFTNLGITWGVSLFVVGIYLVIIPMFCNAKTLGRMAMKVEIVQKDGSKVTKKNIIMRELVGTLLFYVFLGSFSIFLATIILVTTTGRSLVDFIGKTNLVSMTGQPQNPNSGQWYKEPSKEEFIDAEFKEVKEDPSDDEYHIV